MTAEELLERLARVYESATSYLDEGVVLTYRRDTPRADEEPFRTWFLRPHFIRLDWSSHHPYAPLRHLITNFSVSSDGTRHTRRSDSGSFPLETETEAGLIFAGSATVTVPNLLLPAALGAFRFDQLTQLKVLDDSTVDGVVCYRLEGEHPYGTRYELSISKGDYLLRQLRTDSRTTIEENDTYSGIRDEIFRGIQINVPMDPSCFDDEAFGAPSNSA